jgi:spore coat polysaccharide biosynthesis predicted glycosyltransferase SpsG
LRRCEARQLSVNRLSVVAITDGGPRLGLGHVQQAITLMRRLQPAADVRFLTSSDETISQLIASAGFPVRRLDDDEIILAELRIADPDIVLFDKLDVSPKLARAIRETLRAALVIFTNLSDANRFAHMAVTAGIGSELRNVHYVDPEHGTRYYFGPRYWVLRPDFSRYSGLAKTLEDSVQHVLLTFGGSDPHNYSSAALEALLEMDRDITIDIILGAHFPFEKEVDEVIRRFPGKAIRVTKYRNVECVAELMRRADLVMASPGLSTFEALRVGTPVLLMPQNAMQQTYATLMRMVERDDLHTLAHIIERKEFTHPSEPRIQAMEIGEGIDELVEMIVELGNVARARSPRRTTDAARSR